MRLLALALIALCAEASALAQTVTLTEKSGRPLTVGTGKFAFGLSAGKMSPEAVATEFQRLCLPDPLGAGSNAAASPFAFQAGEVTFPATGKHGEIKIQRWASEAAVLTIAPADVDLKNEPITIDERAYQVTGGYGPFQAGGDQCNLVVMMPSFNDARKIGELLAVAFGPGGKLVVKNTFADGHWAKGDTKINFTTPSTKAGSQPVHLSVQISKKGSRP